MLNNSFAIDFNKILGNGISSSNKPAAHTRHWNNDFHYYLFLVFILDYDPSRTIKITQIFLRVRSSKPSARSKCLLTLC